MKKASALLALFIPLCIYAQQETKGIHFEENLTWQQLLGKAKAENKYIFVDCYATWCAPCKLMDQNIYPLKSVGDQMNEKFISIKVQMDTSQLDNEVVKSWYKNAHDLMQQYKVRSFPSFLFLSPDGNIVHKGIGYKNNKNFIELLGKALDPEKRYYTLLESYQKGNLEYAAMPYLAYGFSRELGDRSVSEQIANNYIINYLEKAPKSTLLTKEDIDFERFFGGCLNSKSKIFDLCLHNTHLIDSIANDSNCSTGIVNRVVTKEEVTPFINISKNENTVPNWKKISNTISRKYGSGFARHNVFIAERDWYKEKKQWKEYAKFIVLLVEEDGPGKQAGFSGALYLNDNAWNVFLYSYDKKELEKALSWIDYALIIYNKPFIEGLDTKANILYKLSRRNEAIALEEQVLVLALASQKETIQTCLEKMKKGEKTW